MSDLYEVQRAMRGMRRAAPAIQRSPPQPQHDQPKQQAADRLMRADKKRHHRMAPQQQPQSHAHELPQHQRTNAPMQQARHFAIDLGSVAQG